MRTLLLLPLAIALSPAVANDLLISEQLAVGVNPDGSLCDPGRTLCLMYDPDGPQGPAPLGLDLLLPGRAFEAWGVSWRSGGEDRLVTASAPDASGPVSLDWSPQRTTPELVTLRGSSDLGGGLAVQVDIDLPRDGHVAYLTHTFTASERVASLEVVRTIDHDPDFGRDRSYATRNEAVDDIVVAGSRHDVGTALAVALDGGVAAVCTNWCVSPDMVRAGVAGPLEADRVIGVRSQPVDLNAGESVTLRFVYALAESPDLARTRAEQAKVVVDLDGDGVTEADGDCDDRHAAVYPGAPHRSDGLDNDCDGEVDLGPADLDGDEDGFTPAQGDCDDTDPRVYPGADPVEGIADANCDGIDDHNTALDGEPPEGWGVVVDRPSAGCAASPVPRLAQRSSDGPAWPLTLGFIALFFRRSRRSS